MSEEGIIPGADPYHRLRVWEAASGLFRFSVERWSKFYEPSPEDDGPVEGGLWGGECSGLYGSKDEAEQAGRFALSASASFEQAFQRFDMSPELRALYLDIARLCAGLDVPRGEAVVPDDYRQDEASWIRQTSDGRFELLYRERGNSQVVEAGTADEILFRVLRGITQSVAIRAGSAWSRRGQDSRRRWYPRQVQLMEDARPGWGARMTAHQAACLAENPFMDR